MFYFIVVISSISAGVTGVGFSSKQEVKQYVIGSILWPSTIVKFAIAYWKNLPSGK
jgi:hypothetical protein